MSAFPLLRTIALLLSFLPLSCLALKPGGGNLNPRLYTHEESIERFQDLRFGLSIHWGPSSLGGREISWSRGKEIPKDTYDNFYKDFNPVEFDAEAWVELARVGGMRYILLTAKHHDGFSLWNSSLTDYDIANTPFKRDVVAELAQACRKAGVVFGCYYSILDWYHPDYQPYEHGGPGALFECFDDTPNFERYLVFMKSQLAELVQDYGAEIIQFDGEWQDTWNHRLGSDLYLYLRKLNDALIVNSRVDVGRYFTDETMGAWDWKTYAGDFEERERLVDWVEKESNVFRKSDVPWQAWVTIDQAQWSWNPAARLLPAEEIIVDLVRTIGDGGNYLINLGPQPDGTFDPDQASILRTVGAWVEQHKDAIYGTRGGPFSAGSEFTSTVREDAVYLFILDESLKHVEFDSGGLRIESVHDWAGNKLGLRTAGDSVVVDLPPNGGKGVRVIKLGSG